MQFSLGAVALTVLLSACSDPVHLEDAGLTDGGADADGSTGPTALPVEPTAPMAVGGIERACPEGWGVADTGCAPFASEPTCAGAEAALPGESGCVSIGAPCPTGEFADPPASGDVIYVSASAASAGDGSLGSPYRQLAAAVARATRGSTILLSKGAHLGQANIPDGVHIRGACAAQTSLRPSVPAPDYPTFMVDGGSSEISDLTISGDRPGIGAVGSSASVTVRGVLIEGVLGVGMLAQGGNIVAEEIIIRDVRAAGALTGRAADANSGGAVELRRAMFERTAGGGTLVSSGARATIADVTYRDLPARAVSLQGGAEVQLDRVSILRVDEVGLNANESGTTVRAADLVIDGVASADMDGRAISIAQGATFDGAGVYISHIEENALYASDEGTSVTIADARFTDVGERGINGQRGAVVTASRIVANDVRQLAVLASSGGDVTVRDLDVVGGNRALRAQTGASLLAERVRLTDIAGDGVMSSHAGSVFVVEDLTVVGGGGDDSVPVRGGVAFTGSSLTIRRAAFTNCAAAGVSIFDEDTTALLEDLDVSDVRARFDGTAGFGITVATGSLEVNRVRITRAHTAGILMASGARAVVRDVFVSATAEEPLSGLWGRAVSAQGPDDRLTVERGVFEESIAAGVFAGGEGTTFELGDVIVRTTRRRDCTTGICIEEGGVGLVSYYGASVRAESFLLTDNDVAGAQLGQGGVLDLIDGEVSHHPIGVSIQTAGYDVGRLSDQVRYIDNGSNLDTDELPVPSESGVTISTDEPPED